MTKKWKQEYCGVKVKVAQLCLALCDPMDYTAHGILRVRILEWVAISFSRGSSQPKDQTHVSYVSCTARQVLYHLGVKSNSKVSVLL